MAPWSGEEDPEAAAPDGGGRRGGGLGLPCCDDFMRQDRLSCIGLGGDLDEEFAGRGFVDLAGSPLGNAKVDLVATPGRRPQNRWDLVATWMKTAWAEGSPSRLDHLRAMRRSIWLLRRGGGLGTGGFWWRPG